VVCWGAAVSVTRVGGVQAVFRVPVSLTLLLLLSPLNTPRTQAKAGLTTRFGRFRISLVESHADAGDCPWSPACLLASQASTAGLDSIGVVRPEPPALPADYPIGVEVVWGGDFARLHLLNVKKFTPSRTRTHNLLV
jgi:hypothetical protein